MSDGPSPDAATIVGLLAHDERRRVVAALVLGAATVDEVRSATGLSTRAVVSALARLGDAGLVERAGVERAGGHTDSYVLLGEAFRRAARAARAAAAERSASPDPSEAWPDSDARVLRAFFQRGRIVSIPVQRAKRRVVLNRLAQEFDVGVRYPEREVNTMLRRFHDDVASLRRYLVDEEFLARNNRVYWRTGGTVDLEAD